LNHDSENTFISKAQGVNFGKAKCFLFVEIAKKMFPETTPKIIYKIAPILGSILEANNLSPQPSWSWSGTNPRWGPKDLRWMVCSFRPERVGAHSLVAAKNCQQLQLFFPPKGLAGRTCCL